MDKSAGEKFCLGVFCGVFWCLVASTDARDSSIILISPSGSFSTPTFPSRYPPATEYIWLIKAKPGMYVKLTFETMDIEEYKGKCIDIIEIKDGKTSEAPLLGGFCNANRPATSIVSSSTALRVWFQSARNSDGGSGFNATYTTLKDGGCGGKLQSFPGTFSTPRYPSPYPSNRKCTWNIMAPPGKFIRIEFHGIYHVEYQCVFLECECLDTLDIKDGNRPLPYPPFNGYCFSKPRAFTSKTNLITVKFVTDDAGRYEGFNATYSLSLTPGCGGNLFRDTGVFTSPNYPHSYHTLSRCIWRITVSPGHYVSLTFHAFDVTEVRHACLTDNVEIRDGYAKDSLPLAKLCNANRLKTVNSTGNKMYISFQAGLNKNLAKGFKATFSSHLKENSSWNTPTNIATTVTSTTWNLAVEFLGILILILWTRTEILSSDF